MNHHFGRPVFKNPEGKIQPPLLLLTVTYTTAVLWQMEPYSHDPARGADVLSLSSKPLVKTCLCENRINKKKKRKTYWTTADVCWWFPFFISICPSQMQWHVYLKRIKCGSCCGWWTANSGRSLAWIIWVCNPGPKMRSICLPKKQTWWIFSDPMFYPDRLIVLKSSAAPDILVVSISNGGRMSFVFQLHVKISNIRY